ncbi:quinolinate synthase [Brumimicrobium salinarum]|uniref:Quinolinate synthase n=1 Tax=Brumimicrobium salinarum TaxID=2058658 RepID=A0A2I0R6D0_9FLAO|nr:quinolinate synthase NadA [Brumimicrobium salinarum]PKR82143.1 quinolinate synthase [Brumimicrobium salinarum]
MEKLKKEEFKNAIIDLKKEKNAVVLAHYYQEKDIQEVADYIGDSLGLAVEASKTDADIIVFAGVHFMAETAKLLNPSRKVVLPDLEAGCSLADSCPPDQFKAFVDAYPDHKVVTYVNCSAEVKALSDIVCTSSNAVDIINSFPPEQKLIFAPDQNLGKYLIKETGRDLVLWEGACIVHEAFSFDKLLKLKNENPSAKVVAHPESEPHILDVADYVGSTSKMINYIKTSEHQTFIVGTEAGILHELSKQAPGKTLIPLPIHEDNTCACSECAFMKVNTLEKVYNCLLHETPEINIADSIFEKAKEPIVKMIEFSALNPAPVEN